VWLPEAALQNLWLCSLPCPRPVDHPALHDDPKTPSHDAMTTTKLTRPEIIQDLLELYEGENPSTFADWLNAQTDCQLSVLWKNAFYKEANQTCNCSLGSILSQAQLKRVDKLVNQAMNHGATDQQLVQALKDYLNSFGGELRAKGVLPDYLAYVIFVKVKEIT
jgi:hypothetical protein